MIVLLLLKCDVAMIMEKRKKNYNKKNEHAHTQRIFHEMLHVFIVHEWNQLGNSTKISDWLIWNEMKFYW